MVTTAKRQSARSTARLSVVPPRTAGAMSGKASLASGGVMGRLLQLLRSAAIPAALKIRVKSRRQDLQVLERLNLGAKKQVILLSCKGERFLIGTGADSVDTIVRLRPLTGTEDDKRLRRRSDDLFEDRS